ncbi:MAG TPA: DUF87 domain-containing protein [Woeseiaceae bacterium]|nr:DUF87 domain-containing protein [Woeseiaceae bacterium]
MQDFEKLGAFYVGKAIDETTGTVGNELILYDSKDLTTHAVIIGMTGSGKTGLGIGLIEEAAMDHVPVIAIDPKGDLGNLLLTFPDLGADDFEPWVNPSAAVNQGRTVRQFAADQAALWKKGLADWGQDGERIRALRERADMAVYTPGSTAGLPVSVLRSFAAPDQAFREDRDLYRERVQATATSILSLLGIDADPVSSREHILIANLLDHHWSEGRDLDVATLIGLIQNPPLTRIGVMSLDAFYPPDQRFKLAMQLNSLLAAPGFEAWMEGEPLSAQGLFYTGTGKPRVSVMSIAHLSDPERMFFVSMLLNEIIAWMRAQPGTASLRALLYMDEIFGYMPPVANPPSKLLLLTLLKQARAYGLGLVLSTQNPVDLDYKGLSNTGTWFIGRLQTERDKARVMQGLEGAATGTGFDRGRLEQTIGGLGKRRFLLHNVHEDGPVVFNTRWVMSYLPGPLTRDQIRRLMAERREAAREAKAAPGATAPAPSAAGIAAAPPVMPPEIHQYWLPAGRENPGDIVYRARLIGSAEAAYTSSRYAVDEQRRYLLAAEPGDGPAVMDWNEAQELPVDAQALESRGLPGTAYAPLAEPLAAADHYADWERELKRWIRNERPVVLYRNRELKFTSEPGESEAEFRIRLQQAASEKRDQAVAKLRKRYASKVNTLENRLLRARQTLERESQQVAKKGIDTVISVGTAILGAVLGRKRLSTTTAGRIGSAVKTAGGMHKEAGDVARAEETVARVEAELAELDARMKEEVAALDTAFDAHSAELEEIPVRAAASNIRVHFVGLLWVPHRRTEDDRLIPLAV